MLGVQQWIADVVAPPSVAVWLACKTVVGCLLFQVISRSGCLTKSSFLNTGDDRWPAGRLLAPAVKNENGVGRRRTVPEMVHATRGKACAGGKAAAVASSSLVARVVNGNGRRQEVRGEIDVNRETKPPRRRRITNRLTATSRAPWRLHSQTKVYVQSNLSRWITRFDGYH